MCPHDCDCIDAWQCCFSTRVQPGPALHIFETRKRPDANLSAECFHVGSCGEWDCMRVRMGVSMKEQNDGKFYLQQTRNACSLQHFAHHSGVSKRRIQGIILVGMMFCTFRICINLNSLFFEPASFSLDLILYPLGFEPAAMQNAVAALHTPYECPQRGVAHSFSCVQAVFLRPRSQQLAQLNDFCCRVTYTG